MRIKAEKMSSLLASGGLWKSKNLTIFATSLIKGHLFLQISGYFLIMVLITIVSLSLSLSKVGNNFICDTNLSTPNVFPIDIKSAILKYFSY